MKILRPLFITAVILAGFVPAAGPATAMLEETYDPGRPRAVTPWYGVAGDAERRADLDFIRGMKPHHQGALTMSQDYLASPDARSGVLKQLARGIIHNQEFEIGVLDSVRGHIERDEYALGMQRLASEGQVQKQRFFRAPMPGPIDAWAGDPAVSARDVQFAKAMIVHHQAALDMCGAYLGDAAARNGYLEQLCLDIIRDQAQEIAFMDGVMADYPGDLAAVEIDASMIHGMEGMNHGTAGGKAKGHAGHH